MNNFQRALNHKNSSSIDDKIAHLDEMMVTTGMYSNVKQDNGAEEVPPTFGEAPLGDLGQDNFQWPDQGDGSDPDNLLNLSGFTSEDALGRDIPIYDYLPGIDHNRWDRNPDYSIYPDGKPPYAILYDGRALASTRYFVLNEDGLNFVIQIGAFTTPGPYTELQKAISNWVNNGDKSDLTTETVYIWGGLQVLLGQYYQASQYFPSDRSTTTDPVADRGLYAYTMYVPGRGNSNFATDPGVRAKPPKVIRVISRDNLGDPNYYPGPINTLINLSKGIVDFGKGIIDFISDMTGGGGPIPTLPIPTPPLPPPPDDTLPPPPPPEDTLSPPPPPPEDESDDRPLVPLGYDENGNPTGFTRLSESQMEQYKDGGGDAAIREGKSLNEVLQQGYDNRTNAVTNFTDGVNDGITLVKDVNQTINDAAKNGDIVYVDDEPYIRDGASGSESNPIETNLSDSARSELVNYLRDYETFDGDNLNKVVNGITQNGLEQSDGHLGLKGTHNNVTGKPYFDEAGNFHIPDTYGYGGSDDIRGKWGGTVGVVSDVLEYTGNSLGQEGWGEDFETYMDEAGPVGDAVELLTGEPLPGKDDPIVHFETVITAEELAGSSLGDRGQNKSTTFWQPNESEVKESTLFEKWKKKDQKKSESKPSQLQLIYNYFYYLPKVVKKMILMDMKVEAQIMMLPPDQKSFREKELRNTLINKHHEVYMDEKFPENLEKTSRVKKILDKNIKLTDPRTFKSVKQPVTYEKMFKGEDPNKRVRLKDYSKKSPARFFKKENKTDTSRIKWLGGHVDINRVKELNEEKKERERIAELKKQQEIFHAEMSRLRKEKNKHYDWRTGKDLTEGMTTDALIPVTLDATGDVDLVGLGHETPNPLVQPGAENNNGTYTFGPVDLEYGYASTLSFTRRIDLSQVDTVVFDFTAGDITTFEFAVNSSFYNLSTSSGSKLITLKQSDKVKDAIMSWVVDKNRGEPVGTNRISGIALQRRAPMNVFVGLDDPEASAFIRDTLDSQSLSPDEKKKKLEEQLGAGADYLVQMYGEGIFTGATEISDVELQQSFADIAQRDPYTDDDGANPFDPTYDKDTDELLDDSDFDPDTFEYAGDSGTEIAGGNYPYGTPGMEAPYTHTRPMMIDVDGKKKKINVDDKTQWPSILKKAQGTSAMVAHYEPQGKVLTERKRLMSPKDLTESMVTTGALETVLPAEGDVDLENIVKSAEPGTSESGGSGGTYSYGDYNGAGTAGFSIVLDSTKFDTIKFNATTGNTDRIELSVGTNPISYITLSSGTNVIHIKSSARTKSTRFVFNAVKDGAVSGSTGAQVSGLVFQRRTPISAFVGLDDPDASAFLRDGQLDNLSPEEKKKKLEKQLRSSKEYLNKMFGKGMPATATQIADYEPQQSFTDLQQSTGDSFADKYGLPADYKDRLTKANAYFHNNIRFYRSGTFRAAEKMDTLWNKAFKNQGFTDKQIDTINREKLLRIDYGRSPSLKAAEERAKREAEKAAAERRAAREKRLRQRHNATLRKMSGEAEARQSSRSRSRSGTNKPYMNIRVGDRTSSNTGRDYGQIAQLSPQTEKDIDAKLLKVLERGDFGSGPQIQKQIDRLKRNIRQGTPGGGGFASKKQRTMIASRENPRNTGGSSSGDPANIQWPRDKYPNKKAPPGPGARPPTAQRRRTMVAHHEPQGETIMEKKQKVI